MNLEDHVRRYTALAERADRLFLAAAESHPELIKCQAGCDECCSVYFELSLIESFYLSGIFRTAIDTSNREKVLARAREAEFLFKKARRLLKVVARTDVSRGEQTQNAAAKLKIQCPLNEAGACALYDHRPITCRLYGTPQKIGDRTVCCPRSGFSAGGSYSTVDVDEIQSLLFQYSQEFLIDLIGVGPSAPPGPLFSAAAALTATFDKKFFLSLRHELADGIAGQDHAEKS
jgi:Fe-S-cluster containining protein